MAEGDGGEFVGGLEFLPPGFGRGAGYFPQDTVGEAFGLFVSGGGDDFHGGVHGRVRFHPGVEQLVGAQAQRGEHLGWSLFITAPTGADKREELQHVAVGFLIAEKPSKLRAMKNTRERKYAERWEHFKASVRAKVEHPFRVVKRQFGYTKVRYRGLAKNAAQVLTLFALSNLWMARRRLLLPAG